MIALVGCRGVAPGVPGSGVAKTEQRTVADFDEIEIQGAGKLDASIGPLSAVSVTSDDNLLPMLETTVRGKTLVIRERENIRPKNGPSFKVTVPNIKTITVNGAASINVTGIKNESLIVAVRGAGKIELAGQTQKLDFQLDGAGALYSMGLTAKRVAASINGTGAAEVNAVDELKASLTGMGSITYVGDPKVEKSIGGLGRVSKKG